MAENNNDEDKIDEVKDDENLEFDSVVTQDGDDVGFLFKLISAFAEISSALSASYTWLMEWLSKDTKVSFES